MGVDTAGMDQAAYRKAAIDAMKQLSADMGIPTKLEDMREEDLDFLAQSAAADACAPGNRRAASVEVQIAVSPKEQMLFGGYCNH